MFKRGDKGSKDRKPKEKGKNDLADMLGIGGSMMPDDDDDDDSLEAELAALQGRPVQKKRKNKGGEKLMSLDQITTLANDSMKDVDENVSDDDLENDDDLMGELNDILGDDDDDGEDDSSGQGLDDKTSSPAKSGGSGMSQILEERKQMYTMAIQNAKAEGASSKARRYDRGLKEVERLLKLAKAGKAVNEDDIPPPVIVKGATPAPRTDQPPSKPVEVGGSDTPIETPAPVPTPRPIPAVPTPRPIPAPRAPPRPAPSQTDNAATPGIKRQDNTQTLTMLATRRDDYKRAALQKKREGDIASAKQLLGISKRFESVISSVENGEDVNLDEIPPPPGELLAKASSAVQARHSEVPQPEPDNTAPGSIELPADEPPQEASSSPSAPTTMLEALQQRLEKYNKSAEQAKEEGNGGKARRMGRIAKQYQDAIKAHKAGRPFDAEELPVPPGFGPLPGASAGPGNATQQSPAAPSIKTPTPPSSSEKQTSAAVATNLSQAQNVQPMSRNEKELQFLLQRQKEFKVEALKAKKAGDVESAKDYLRQSKGLETMIESAQNGLRVDITTVPKCTPFGASPSATATQFDAVPNDSEEFEFIATDELQRSDSHGERSDVYARLELALKRQIETSTKNVEHYRLLGDLPTAQNFLALQKSSQQDLDTLKVAKAHGEPIPKFHYENKSFPVVRSHPHLSDSEVEICVMRCINIPLPQGYQPKDMCVYVNYEFPFPSDSPQTGYTETVKQTINPEFNQTFKVSIDRKSRSLARVFRRQGVNFTIMYNRGFLKSDKALGQANIKLEKFTNKCKIHECVDLMDTERGRKAVGGKIEVMIKLREPLVDKDAEVVEERWLVLDTHLRSFQMRAKSAYGGQRPNTQADTYESLEVFKLEKDLAEKKIAAFKSQSKSPPAKIVQELNSVNSNMKELQDRLRSGGLDGMRGYLQQLEMGLEVEKTKAQNFLKAGDKNNAKLCLAKKKLLDKEIAALKQRIK